MRRLHRLIGLLLFLPLLSWTATGLVFLIKPGWAGAYEILRAFGEETLDPTALLSPAQLPIPAGDAIGWELGSTALGPVYRISRRGGLEPILVHAGTGAILSPLERSAVEAIARHAASRATASARYGEVDEVALLEREGIVRFAGGAEVRVGRFDLSISQRGPDTVWIDRLYEVHYLRWTGIEAIDRILSPVALGGVWLLAFTGLRMMLRQRRRQAAAAPSSTSL